MKTVANALDAGPVMTNNQARLLAEFEESLIRKPDLGFWLSCGRHEILTSAGRLAVTAEFDLMTRALGRPVLSTPGCDQLWGRDWACWMYERQGAGIVLVVGALAPPGYELKDLKQFWLVAFEPIMAEWVEFCLAQARISECPPEGGQLGT